MDPKQLEFLRRVMETQFIALELNLLLDTHPSDERALQDFRAASRELRNLVATYEAAYGPLLNYGLGEPGMAPCWQWISDPWPWEINWRGKC